MIFINDFKSGDVISGVYQCKSKSLLVTKTGKDYFSLKLGDKTGEVDTKIWDPNSPAIGEFEVNDFVFVNGQIDLYQGKVQCKVTNLRQAEEDEYFLDDYMAASRFNLDSMEQELFTIIDSVKHPGINALLKSFFEDDNFRKRFKTASAAKSVHHGFIGGLLEHSVSVAKLAAKISSNYDFVNHDIVVASALLHDIGKTKEISAFPENDYTDEGNLIGHLVIGYGMIKEHGEKIESLPEVLLHQIEHCILSHHGKLEFGSPKKPATIEAFVLSKADEMDAHLETMRELFDERNENTWIGYNKMLETNLRRTQID